MVIPQNDGVINDASGGLVLHGNHGVRYVSIRYRERFAEVGVVETINGLHKVEVIWRRGPWGVFEAVEFDMLEWIDGFNHRRPLEPSGNIPSTEARRHAQSEEPAKAAR